MATKKKTPNKKTGENLPALVESNLSSTSMAQFANYDMETFTDISLDVADNKELFQNDILIPKVWLVQAMSEMRKEKKAEEGQFVDSQSGEILADLAEELKFVTLKTFKRWQTFKLVQEGQKIKKEFISSEIMVFGKNHDLPYEDTIEGEKIVRRQVISAYILLEKDATQGINRPYIVDFAASSKGAGRALISDIKTLNTPTPNRNGLPCFVGFFNMFSKEQKFDDGSAFVKFVKFGGFLPKTSMAFLADCRRQLDVMEDQIEIDDADVVDAVKSNKGKKSNPKVTGKATTSDAGI